jgi:hypothetical protein
MVSRAGLLREQQNRQYFQLSSPDKRRMME